MATAGEYRTVLTMLYDQAMFELDAGDLRQASEKLWGVSTQALESLAERQGWCHGLHGEFYGIIERLPNEMDLAELGQRFAFASELHTNCYENQMDESEIRKIVVHVRDFVERLARL